MILLRTLLFTIIVPGTVTVLLPAWIRSSDSTALPLGPLRYLGLFPILAGISIYAWCAWDFTFAGKGTPAPIDPPKELVVRGLYRWLRNPMYVGVTSILVGEAWLFASPRLMAYAAVVPMIFHLTVVLYEEPTLRGQFGEVYERYCLTVPRWVPRRQRRARESADE